MKRREVEAHWRMVFHCIPAVISSYLILKTGLVAGFMNCMEDLMCPYGLYKMLLAASRIKIN